MVKILMVHGFGVNAKIFEAQTAPVRALLPSHWEYHFLQGPFECGPAPGIGEIYPNQIYNCFFFVPSLVEFQSVHEFLEDVIEEEGPFDAAWGFSAGAMIIGSLLLRYQHERPNAPLPFRSAIYMNCSMPWSATEDLGYDVTPLVIQHAYVPSNLPEAKRVLQIEYDKHDSQDSMLNDDRNAQWEDGELIPPMIRHAYQRIHEQDVENEVVRKWDDYRAHRMFPEVDKVRLDMPSAHIFGAVDPLKDLGSAMVKMCAERTRLEVEHPFGHMIPSQSPKDLRRVAGCIEKTVTRADFC